MSEPSLPEGLENWVGACAPELGLDPDDVPIANLLSLTGVVAHGVVRPAAPITSFLIGLAVGRGTIASTSAGDEIVRRLVGEWSDA